MDDADRLIVERTRALFERTFPGFITRLERMPGTYLSSAPHRYVRASKTHPEVLHLSLRYLAKARRGTLIKVHIIAEKRAEWMIVEHSFHMGPDPLASSDDDSDTYFRVCSIGEKPHHFHLRGLQGLRRSYDAGHIPLDKADPPLEADLFWFLNLVEQFIETNKILIGVKP